MKFNVRGENIVVTEALREYVEKKVGRIEKYFDTPPTSDVNVTMKVVKDLHTVEVSVLLPGVVLRGEESGEDMYAAIDLVVEKLERQIRKHKTKINRKFRQEGSLKTLFKEEPNGKVSEEEEDDFKVVKTKRFNLKPMDIEEAILQMNMLGHNFFVFSNAETDEMNVVYKRKDGKYALIEPEF
ncbi:ribosome-associated translation inhibitor RaiA [Tepidibacillus infernus]|uniref:Ribosome hibernation promoting factor n=1 Tax=Tepidibacillus decaturensis TaxID=1413211 RepID=A0A135L609_9BACI|nr:MULTISPECIES: ribosome-associated translation inhibitor RaiA [Tepidibacillus]KXG44455.1 Fis family transcriptional regulator [Tepidibacillus decaturensis]GBF10562.1 putative sigma-54 modulation protein [Tepidibacillus sp. HK-1]